MRKFYITFIFFILLTPSFAQLKINLPLSRSVYQRDNKNSSKIYVSGTYENALDKVEARLSPIKTGQGTATDWITIADKVEGGFFNGSISGTGGWYKLEVRGVKDGKVLMQDFVDKVGIGEVFVIVGQSNAEGKRAYGQKAATDDRVNCFNYEKIDYLDEIPPYSNFSQITEEVSIAPRGQGAWCWGELGDYLVKRLNVPVLFFNAAYEGTTVENWYSSSIGVPTKHQFYKFTFPFDTPYSYLRITLQFYISQLGIRAVLWSQGENDQETAEDYYVSSLKSVIEKSRSQSGKKIAWVVARTSVNQNKQSLNVINAQNKVISTTEAVFEGPNTDLYQIPRWDGTHFRNLTGDQGLSELALAWQNSLSDNFFAKSEPFLASPIISITPKCEGNINSVTLGVSNTYNAYLWTNRGNQSSITVSSGTHSCIARDKTGNYFLSNSVNVSQLFPIVPPTIFAKSSLTKCPEAGVELVAESSLPNVRWSSGETTKQILARPSGNYFAQAINNFGCGTPQSNILQVKNFTSPAKPSITLNGSPILCEGNQLVLSTVFQSKYQWSTNDTTRSIILKNAGDFNVSVRVKDQNGCISEPSDAVKVFIQSRPSTPTIKQIGTFTLEASHEQPTSADYYDWKKDDALLNLKNSVIKTTRQGLYTVSAVKTYSVVGQSLTCKSNQSATLAFIPENIKNYLTVYPNPTSDGVVYVEGIQDFTDLVLGVYSVEGKEVLRMNLAPLTERRRIDLSNLEPAKYVVRIFNPTYTFDQTRHILIEK